MLQICREKVVSVQPRVHCFSGRQTASNGISYTASVLYYGQTDRTALHHNTDDSIRIAIFEYSPHTVHHDIITSWHREQWSNGLGDLWPQNSASQEATQCMINFIGIS